ncbi:hypothetical protein MVES_001943 [Malassezia vespertilionis]|uniref:Uncharacterized protein n=1 Tax=Malassezia vespertilionis TaxID=2020962 RepID=A0A2N1JCA5_9BASI|nr:hypothetical protein MVES_001943 [Malassezia vespertilionis]
MGKSMRLTFKGDKRPAYTTANDSDAEMYGGDDQETPYEITGPCFLYQTNEGTATALFFNAPLGQPETTTVTAPELPVDLAIDGATFAGAEITPQDVHQVWVAHRVAETDKWTLKSAQGTFLGCDQFGSVIAFSEARGPQEEWAVKMVEPAAPGIELGSSTVRGARRGIALQSTYGGWLTLEPKQDGAKRHTLRADDKELQPSSIWDARVQWKYRHEVRRSARPAHQRGAALEHVSIDTEVHLIRSRQAWNAGGRALDTVGSRRALEKAQREGRLSEAMLDRRMKLKSDKFA